MKKYTYYIIYKITDIINNMVYIGQHATNDLNDNYMGSGTILRAAQLKYGMHNFKKQILKVFDNEYDMDRYEQMIVNKDFINSNRTYNIVLGGKSGIFRGHCKITALKHKTKNCLQEYMSMKDDYTKLTPIEKSFRNYFRLILQFKTSLIDEKTFAIRSRRIFNSLPKHIVSAVFNKYNKTWSTINYKPVLTPNNEIKVKPKYAIRNITSKPRFYDFEESVVNIVSE